MPHALNLVVIYTAKLEEVKAFYEKLGIKFVAEKHGNGPEHFSATFANRVLFEIYPGKKSKGGIGFETIRYNELSLRVITEAMTPTFEIHHGRRYVILHDPDGRRVQIVESISSPR
ncbi:MAG: hypothetical protein NTX72_03205 [Candidatus Uhrbacteria bacterium]|nr:hypothetical protein [Candidatus Uhrbacteria bacterium]